MKDKKTEIPAETPWGAPQDVDIIADGIVFIHTAGHGGYWLSPERNKKVPISLKKKTFCQNGLDGWYEEDCDAALVESVFAKVFPDLPASVTAPGPRDEENGSAASTDEQG